jgi:hypothetical protein
MNWKRFGNNVIAKWRYNPDVCLEKLRETTKIFQDFRYTTEIRTDHVPTQVYRLTATPTYPTRLVLCKL